LKNDVATARRLHESLQRQQVETAVNAALVASNLRVIERPEVPIRPSRPNVGLDLVFGVLAGIVLALGAVFGCDYFDSSVKSSEEVEELLHLPALATIPNFALAGANGKHAAHGNGNGAATELIVVREPWSRIAEAFRSMRTA